MKKRRAAHVEASGGRHRLAFISALGAVGIGALALAGAVSGAFTSENLGASQTAQSAPPVKQEPAGQEPAKQASAVEAPKAEPADAKVEGTAAPEKVAETSIKPAATADATNVKPQPTHVAGGKSASLSPDERIERAMDRVASSTNDETVKNALKMAAQDKARGMDENGDTVVTASVSDSSAYAPSARGTANSDALDAIRGVDRSEEAKAEPTAEEAPAAAPAAASAAPKAAAPSGPLSAATVTTAVNMRSSMDNKASVVATVPAKAAVQASQSCKSWCEVVYNGRRGYIYKSFIRRGAAQAAAPASAKSGKPTADTAAKATDPATTASTQTDAKSGENVGLFAQTGDPQALADAARQAQQRRQ